jgi:hypothetical protein
VIQRTGEGNDHEDGQDKTGGQRNDKWPAPRGPIEQDRCAGRGAGQQ